QLSAEDLLTETRETWHQKHRSLTLTPDQPYRVFQAQETRVEAPFCLFGESDAGQLSAEDLLTETRETWHQKHRSLTLTPDQPYRV
ncbi:hypothetical protein CTI14_66100, partial [Methylobacterium radiotolerans]